MTSKRISSILLATVAANLLFGANAFAVTKDVSGSESFDELNVTIDGNKTDAATTDKKILRTPQKVEAKTAVANLPAKENCDFNYPDVENYSAAIVAVRKPLKVEPNETFKIKVFLKNTGNIPWFSNASQCHGAKMSLGTDKERDHASVFYQKDLQGWEGSNRIAMDQLRVNPDQIASFTFFAKAGSSPDLYKEYFTPVLKDLQWIDGTSVYLDVIIGDNGDNATDVREKLAFSRESGSVANFDLHAQKTIKVNLSEQKIYVYLGDTDVRDFRVSTGKAETPTPTGNYDIILKQDVRVGYEPPHYVMPKYMMFQSSGYGFHALPSLARNGDEFWTEARNHIGIPVSHGCVRLLPEDADWLFDFTDVGTKVKITY